MQALWSQARTTQGRRYNIIVTSMQQGEQTTQWPLVMRTGWRTCLGWCFLWYFIILCSMLSLGFVVLNSLSHLLRGWYDISFFSFLFSSPIFYLFIFRLSFFPLSVSERVRRLCVCFHLCHITPFFLPVDISSILPGI